VLWTSGDPRDRLTWRELAGRSTGEAEKFADRGVGQGDVVCVELPNCAANVLSTLAAWRPGATVVPLRPFCKERLAAFKGPRTFKIVVEIGRSEAGKISRRVLVEAREEELR
jgi:acyl-CoA synthetase (AMP-forming)/AMP-acid ligase II